MADTTDIQTIRARLRGVKGGADSFTALCPAHDDKRQSLSVSKGRGGRVLLKCHAGCKYSAIKAALGGPNSSSAPARIEGPTTEKEVAAYVYTDAQETPLYRVVRFDVFSQGKRIDKTFKQQRHIGAGDYAWGIRQTKRVLYRLPAIIEAIACERTVYVVEGEKDADRLASLGIEATTCSGGSSAPWLDSYSETLRGADVVILPDNDVPGLKYGNKIALALQGIARSVLTLRLPGLAPGADVSDWFDGGRTVSDLTALVAAATQQPASDRRSDAPAFLPLSVLLTQPELLAPPVAVIPRLAYAGRTTCIAAPDKAGKSTFTAAAQSALTRGATFLGEPCRGSTGRVVSVGLEEAVGDAVQRFAAMRADPERVQLVVGATPDLLRHLRELIGEWRPDLVSVDSLTEYARVVCGTVPLDGDASGWASVIRPLVAITREFPATALVILHHTRRSDGQYRGTGEIAAAVDCMLEMRGPSSGESQTLRHFKGRARWTVPNFAVEYADGLYRLAGQGELSLSARILHHVGQNLGVSLSRLREIIGGRAGLIDKEVADLVTRGMLLDNGKKGHHAYYLPGPQQGELRAA